MEKIVKTSDSHGDREPDDPNGTAAAADAAMHGENAREHDSVAESHHWAIMAPGGIVRPHQDALDLHHRAAERERAAAQAARARTGRPRH